MTVQIYQGDCRQQLFNLDPNTVDSVVTDPPYGLSFMGKAWDYDVPDVEVWKQCYRVLKPGGHLLAFFGSRTYHRGVIPIEDAGFEIRDQMMWLYGSGFPKSHNVSIAIDKMKGAEREVVDVKGQRANSGSGIYNFNNPSKVAEFYEGGWNDTYEVTAASSDEAKQWDGWGTCLKPGHEPIVLARKPFEGTVAQNVLDHGTGAINIDGCRTQEGKFPANVMHDGLHEEWAEYFYCPKASKGDRNEGLEHLEDKPIVTPMTSVDPTERRLEQKAKNIHPTVKPNELMRYLCRLVTPPGGTVLDPFTGSGSTGKAAKMEGFSFVGCELDPEYVEIARARANYEAPQRSIF